MTEKRLKVAIQLFGHMRTFDKCAPSLYKYLLKNYDCDIFIHTWSKLNHQTKTWHNNVSGHSEDTNENKIRRVYPNVKAVKIEEQKPVDMGIAMFEAVYKPAKAAQISIFGLHSMFYSVAQANMLREEYERANGVKYDWVVCIRPDVLLKRDVDIENLLNTESPEDIDKGMFCFTNIFTKVVRDFRNFGASDIFYFGRPGVIGDIIHHLPEPSKIFKNKKVYGFAPEYVFAQTAENLGYIPYRVNYVFDKDFTILRRESLRKKFIRLYAWRDRTFVLALLPGILPPIFYIKFGLFGLINVNISLGNVYKE